MKKILLSTTFVVMSVGMASAQLSLSGGARFGALYMGSLGAVGSTFGVTNRFTLNIDGNAETDGGANFFARVRIRGGNTGPFTGPPSAGPGASAVSAPRVGVSFGGFTLATGNINGALESMPGLYDGAVGLTGLGWGNVVANRSTAGTFAWDSFSSGGGGSNGVEAIYSAGAFAAHISYSDSTDTTVPVLGTPTRGQRLAANVSYTFGDWTAALGMQSSNTAFSVAAVNEDMIVATIGGSFGDFGVGAAYASMDNANTWRINGSYAFGSGTTVVGYVSDSSNAAATSTAYGLGFTQSLGGAVLVGGVVRDSVGRNRADLGVRFSF